MTPVSRVGEGGRYKLQALLGIGGMARVYRATDTQTGDAVAVKLVSVLDGRVGEVLARRLRAEARAMARIAHPNVLRVLEVSRTGEQDYIVTALAEGGSLKGLLDREGPLSPRRAISYLIQTLSALAAAHTAGIVHRDVKPHNLLLDGEDRVLLADFGVAMLAYEESLRNTRSNATLGSLWFMPPEQRLDPRHVDPRADVYACGATLYHLLTDASPMDLFGEADDSPRWAGIPEPIRALLRRATAREPADRFPSAKAMAEALIPLLDTLPALDRPLRPRREGSPDAALGATVEERPQHGMATTFQEEESEAVLRADPLRSAVTFLVDDIEDLREQVEAGTLFDEELRAALEGPSEGAPAPPGEAALPLEQTTPVEASPPATGPTSLGTQVFCATLAALAALLVGWLFTR